MVERVCEFGIRFIVSLRARGAYVDPIPIWCRGGDEGLSSKRHNSVKLSAQGKNDGITEWVLRFDVRMGEPVSAGPAGDRTICWILQKREE